MFYSHTDIDTFPYHYGVGTGGGVGGAGAGLGSVLLQAAHLWLFLTTFYMVVIVLSLLLHKLFMSVAGYVSTTPVV